MLKERNKMKTQLIKISEDKIIEAPYPGKYRGSNGTIMHGIYIRKYKNTMDKLFINNGHIVRKYKYPNIDQKFFSSKINDYNLHLCGGWVFKYVNKEEAIGRVIKGLKPMGFLVTTEIDQCVHFCKKSGLPYNIIHSHRPTKNHHIIGISCKGTFDQNFNLQDLIADYINYASNVKTSLPIKKIENFILSLKNIEVASYLTSDYANPNTDQKLIVTGLILGYPIETTVSIMWM